MNRYREQWAIASGHAVRHPLRLKMEYLQTLCHLSADTAAFERALFAAQGGADTGAALLAAELLPLWQSLRAPETPPRTSGD